MLEGPTAAGGFQWYKVMSSSGEAGWVAESGPSRGDCAYYLTRSGSAPAVGSAEASVPPLDSSIPSVLVGGEYTGTLAEGDAVDRIQLRLTAPNNTVAFTLTSTELNMVPGLTLWNSAGDEVATDSNNDDAVAKLRERTLEPDLYTISAWTIRGGGAYSLKVFDGSLPPNLAQPEVPLPTPTPVPGYTSSRALMADHGIRVSTPYRFSLTYPTPSEDTQDSRLSNLQILDAATLYIEGPDKRAEVCFPAGDGRFLLRYRDDGEFKVAPLQKRLSGDLTCVNVSMPQWGTIVRVANSDATETLWDSAKGDYRKHLIGRIGQAMPNPVAFLQFSTLCLVSDLYNHFMTSPIADFSVAFSNVLYNDVKHIQNEITENIIAARDYFVEQLMESPYVYNFVTEFAEPIIEHIAHKMESLEIEFPTEEQLNHWAHEAYDTLEDVWDIAEKTHTLATLATFLKEVPVRALSGMKNHAFNLPDGLTSVQKVKTTLEAGRTGGWRGLVQFTNHEVLKAKSLMHAAVTKPKAGFAILKGKAVLLTKLPGIMLSAAKAKFAVIAKAPAFVAAKAVAAGVVWVVIARGTTGAIYDIIDGKYDEYYAQRDAEVRRIRQQCFHNMSQIGNLSPENFRIIQNSFDELMKSYGL